MSDENQVPADAEALPTPIGNGQPQAASDDPATAAFEALREEVVLVHRAVVGLRAATAIPDYSETLGSILQASTFAARKIKILAELPTLRATPEDIGREITAAAETARRSDQTALMEASTALREAVHDLKGQLQSVRTADTQRDWLLIAGIGGVLAGMLIWSLIAGPLVRTMPENWHWPERMAADILAMDEKTAGARLIESASPKLWDDILLGDRIVVANRDALRKCQSEKVKPLGLCTITIPREVP